MGNADSQMSGDEYIQQQKEIIEKQQQQINNLYSSPEYKHKRVIKNKLIDEIILPKELK